jgi:hypothetical protein
LRFDGLTGFFSTGSARTEQGHRPLHGWWLEGSSSAHEAPIAAAFLPTQSRILGDSILLTFGDGIGPRRASSNDAARSVFNSGGGFFWRCFSSMGYFGSDGVGGGSSSKQ